MKKDRKGHLYKKMPINIYKITKKGIKEVDKRLYPKEKIEFVKIGTFKERILITCRHKKVRNWFTLPTITLFLCEPCSRKMRTAAKRKIRHANRKETPL